MAVGGWLYGGCKTIGPFPHAQVNWASAWQGILDLLTALPGWTEATGLTQYNATDGGAYYAVCQYGAGSTGYLIFIFDCISGGTLIHADNWIKGVTYNTYWENPSIYCAWIPPGVAPPGAGTPLTAAWLPVGSFKFQPVTNRFSYNNYDIESMQHQFHMISRGPDVIMLFSNSSHSSKSIDTVFLAGQMLELAHAADTYAYANCAQIGWVGIYDQGGATFGDPGNPGDTNNSNFGNIQCFDYVGNLRNKNHGMRLSLPTGLFSNLINDAAPYIWAPYTLYMSNADLTTYGIIPGDGIKGIISPEWARATLGPRIQTRQRTEAGDMMSIGAGSYTIIYGMVIGWDASNGALVGGE